MSAPIESRSGNAIIVDFTALLSDTLGFGDGEQGLYGGDR
jgi:hypothetical protein